MTTGTTKKIKKDWYQFRITTPNGAGGYKTASGFGTNTLQAMNNAFKSLL